MRTMFSERRSRHIVNTRDVEKYYLEGVFTTPTEVVRRAIHQIVL